MMSDQPAACRKHIRQISIMDFRNVFFFFF